MLDDAIDWRITGELTYGGTKEMSDILEPWLAATIEAELGEALRHWEDGTNRHQSTGKSRELSYDDGSNLRILCTKKGPVVQITKVCSLASLLYLTNYAGVVFKLQGSHTSHTIGQRHTCQRFYRQPSISTVRRCK